MSDIRFKSDEFLIEVMDDLMNEEVSQVPTEREIVAMHTWSDAHVEEMDYILKHGRRKPKEAEKFHFHGMNRWATQAAAIVLILVVGSVVAVSSGLFRPKGAMAPAMAPAAGDMKAESAMATEDAFAEEEIEREEVYAEESTAAMPEAPAAPPEAPAEEYPASAETEGADADKGMCNGVPLAPSGDSKIKYKGMYLYPADEQKLASESTDRKIALETEEPLLDRDSDELTLTIINKEAYTVCYYQDMDIHVLVDGVWYDLTAAYPHTDDEEYMTGLEEGKIVEEVIDLSRYKLDRDAEMYRVAVYFDGQILAKEFGYKEK